MTFRLRQIDFTASGRKIVRDRDLAQSALTIGRAAENDIHLPDLAVEARHARIEARSDGKVAIEALGTLGFTLDGKSVRSAVIDGHSGGELAFGGFRITLSREADGALLVEVGKSAGAGDQVDPVEDKQGFSLAAVMPGKRMLGWIFVALIIGLFLAWPITSHLNRGPDPKSHVSGDGAWNPGPLSRAHHGLTDKCEACHVKPFESVRNETCMGCHKDVHDHAKPERLQAALGSPGLGKSMLRGVAHAFGKPGPGACMDCHVEHQGIKQMEQPRQQFCADCHADLKDRLPDTRLGNAGDFGTSHPQFMASVVTTPGSPVRTRISLDAHPHENNGLTFSHKAHLDPLGGVAKMSMTLGNRNGYGSALTCKNCHRTMEDGVRFQKVNMERDCEACHSLVYDQVGGTFRKLHHGDVAQMTADLATAAPRHPVMTGRSRPGEYATGGIYYPNFAPPLGTSPAQRAFAKDGVCGECHTAEMRGGKLAVRPVTLVSRYMTGGWFNHAAHKQTKCSECHAAGQSQSSTDVLLPGIKQCRDCHQGEGSSEPKVPSGCAMCHAYHVSPSAPPSVRSRRD